MQRVADACNERPARVNFEGIFSDIRKFMDAHSAVRLFKPTSTTADRNLTISIPLRYCKLSVVSSEVKSYGHNKKVYYLAYKVLEILPKLIAELEPTDSWHDSTNTAIDDNKDEYSDETAATGAADASSADVNAALSLFLTFYCMFKRQGTSDARGRCMDREQARLKAVKERQKEQSVFTTSKLRYLSRLHGRLLISSPSFFTKLTTAVFPVPSW